MRAPLEPDGLWHADIRAIAFDPTGRFLATAADDKACGSSREPRGDAWSAFADGAMQEPTALAYDDDGKHLMISKSTATCTSSSRIARRRPGGHRPRARRASRGGRSRARALLRGRHGPDVPAREHLLDAPPIETKARASNLPTSVPLIHGSWDIQSFLFAPA